MFTWAGNVGHVNKNRPDDLELVTTSYLDNLTLGITTITKSIQCQEE